MILQRRAFLTGLASSLIAAPAIVRSASIMPVRAVNGVMSNGIMFGYKEIDTTIESLKAQGIWQAIPDIRWVSVWRGGVHPISSDMIAVD